MDKYDLICADVLVWADWYDGPPFHALFCDPPYHLTPISKRFGKPNSAPAKYGKDGLFQRVSAGFMGEQWDGGDIAFDPETWERLGHLLYPGAFCAAYAGSRGWHRMATAIEEAGFVIHPTIFNWCQGQGLPKATRIDKQVDRMAGKLDERKVIGKYCPPEMNEWNLKQAEDHKVDAAPGTFTASGRRTLDIVEPATDLAKDWVGHRYGLQALKPTIEPIILFQKPYEGRPIENITETGAGALNIDKCRLPIDPEVDDSRLGGKGNWSTDKAGKKVYEVGYQGKRVASSPNGRWPANIVITHHPECGECCHPDCPAALLDEQSGVRKSGPMKPHHQVGKAGEDGNLTNYDIYSPYKASPYKKNTDGDSGGASRFFYQADWNYEVEEGLDLAVPFFYCPKASRSEREAGHGDKKPHPTIKPIKLNQYLAALLLPPDRYAPRRLLNPFAGVCSEAIGALLAGWDHVTTVELYEKYTDIGRKRLDYWLEKRDE